jgi:outer membrane protein assembly factor BamB
MRENSQGATQMTKTPKRAMRYFLALAALALPLLGAGCQQAHQTNGGFVTDVPVISHPAAEKLGLSVRWYARVGLATDIDERVSSITRTKDALYVLTDKNHLVALNAAAGTTSWAADFGEHALQIFPPVEITFNNQPAVVVYNRLRIYVLDKRTGTIAFEGPLPFVASSPAVASGDILCVGSEHQFFYGAYLDLLGKVAWGVRAEDDSFNAAPVLTSAGNVIFCSRKGILWRVSAKDGTAGWNRKTTGEVLAGLVADSRAVYVPCMDRKLYAFELSSSNLLWSARLDGTLDQPAVVAGSKVLAVGRGSGLYAIDIAKGEQRWFVPNVQQMLARTPDHVFVADAGRQIQSINLDTGSVDATVPTNGADVFSSNTVDSTVYMISRDGRVAALEVAPK